jgi:phospholipid/cholesterol/gamma-HCH transport system substrate-binding protein
MENRAYALLAGLFVLLLFIGVVMAAIWFSGDTVKRVNYVLVSNIPVSGLHPKAPVRLRGVDVGKVENIEFDPTGPRVILITIAVDPTAPITKGTYARLGYLGITGLAVVQLDDDGSKADRLEPFGRIAVRPSVLDQAESSAQELLADVGDAAKRVNALLSDQNLAQFSRTLANLEIASKKAGHASQAITEDISSETRKFDRVLTDLHEQPRSLIFGKSPGPPGPGEPGFDSREGNH